MSGWVAGALVVVGVGMIVAGNEKSKKANAAARDNMNMTERIAHDKLEFQKEQQVKLDAQKDIYRAMEFKNPYADNVYEDLTVNQQQAQFESQQGAQQRSNIMQDLKGAAGGSGIAGLAQAMANQGQLATQKASVSIGLQEAQNERLKAQGARQKQVGEASVQDMERSRQSTLLGISMGESAGANAAAMQAQQNQIAAGAAQANLYGQQAASMYGMAGSAIGGAGAVAGSDRKLKKNINLIGESPSGLNIYSFNYKNPKHGEGLFQGVMSDEIPQEAVTIANGYDMVDYNMLDVEFKQI